MEFSQFFQSGTGNSPFPYQRVFAQSDHLPDLVAAPTGSGKEHTIILGWLYRLLHTSYPTPRRLVYCLPMRTLVEQVFSNTTQVLDRLSLNEQVKLYKLMGGAIAHDWDQYPDCPLILVGTQDQLLSRALNRGFAMSRYRWTVHSALLNDDCLWVFDETQLMGAALPTSAQLQGLRNHFGTFNWTHSIWMSATLTKRALQTVDYQKQLKVLTLGEGDRTHPILAKRLGAKKSLEKLDLKYGKEYAQKLAKVIAQRHSSGSLTLVAINRVTRAQAIYQELKKLTTEPLLLVHSRFRESERDRINAQIKEFKGIIVATQAVEAGVDISAKLLVSELAPWSSIVQRVGRCNRRGEIAQGEVLWIDVEIDKKSAAPYTPEELATARAQLICLDNLDISTIERIEVEPTQAETLIPRQQDLLDLFDTTPDLNGFDVDISSFIRDTEDADLQIAWRNWDEKNPPAELGSLRRTELCRLSVNQAKDFLKSVPAWRWDGRLEEWVEVKFNAIYPGLMLLVHCSSGGYSSELGFTGKATNVPTPVEGQAIASDSDTSDYTAQHDWLTLRQHSDDVARESASLAQSLIPPDLHEIVTRSGRWHDYGKAHEVWQSAATEGKSDTIWAKSPKLSRFKRLGFRHELVSALVALQQGEPFLMCYLIACHHGKVRLRIEPRPTEEPAPEDKRYAFGVYEGDRIRAVDLGDGLLVPQQEISLECMELGENSWTSQVMQILEQYGPFKLALLESIVRVADWKASKNIKEVSD